jgi:hypothetical protein
VPNKLLAFTSENSKVPGSTFQERLEPQVWYQFST